MAPGLLPGIRREIVCKICKRRIVIAQQMPVVKQDMGASMKGAVCVDVPQASYTAYQEGREDLTDTIITPAAAEAAATLLSRALEDRKRTRKYLDRLKEVI